MCVTRAVILSLVNVIAILSCRVAMTYQSSALEDEGQKAQRIGLRWGSKTCFARNLN